jgi:hypothetical protein
MRFVAAAALSALTGCAAGRAACVVDRLEGDQGVLIDEQGEVFSVSVRELPAGVREGDVIEGGWADPSRAARLNVEIRALRERLAAGGGRGDLSLESR